MLTVYLPEREFFNEETEEFFSIPEQTLHLEHSLLALSKWEFRHEKPFLGDDEKTPAEILDYIRCMIVTPNWETVSLDNLTEEAVREINEYINRKATATWFTKNRNMPDNPAPGSAITSEIIYYWMVSLQIPFECQKWHLNRLFTLVKTINLKNDTTQKMSKKDIYAQNRALNTARRKKFNSNG